jgi:hypothetical protein
VPGSHHARARDRKRRNEALDACVDELERAVCPQLAFRILQIIGQRLFLDPLGGNEVHKTVKSRGNQPRLNKLVEMVFKATPTHAESASRCNVFW